MNKFYTYTRVQEGNQWKHPDFATTDTICVNKWLNPSDNTEFLVELSEEIDTSKYTEFNVTAVNYEDVKEIFIPKQTSYTKAEFLTMLTAEEYIKFKTSTNAEMIRFFDMISVLEVIDTTDEYVKTSIDLMLSLEIISQGTYDKIM